MRYQIIVLFLCGGMATASHALAQGGFAQGGPGQGGPGQGGLGRANTAENSLSTEVYDISELITTTANIEFNSQNWPGTGLLSGDTRNLNNVGGTVMGGYGNSGGGGMGGYGGMGEAGMGGMGGMGGGGMGGMGGGGMGGMGGGMAGMGGGPGGYGDMGGYGGEGGGMGMGGYGAVNIDTGSLGNGRGLKGFDSDRRRTIVSLLMTIEPNAWGSGGRRGTIRVFENLLIVEQSASVHKKIAEYLDIIRSKTQVNRPLVVEWCVFAEKPNLSDLEGLSDEQNNQNLVVRGMVNCLNRQTVATSSGIHVNYVTGVTPVVGGGSEGSAYSPTTIKALQGWIIETQASLVETGAESPEAIVDIAATHTEPLNEPLPAAEISEGKIDRIALDSQTLAGSVRIPAGRWTLAASFQSEGNNPMTGGSAWLVVRWTEVAGK